MSSTNMRVVPVSRMVVLPVRSWVFPLTEYEVDATCQNPWELANCQLQNCKSGKATYLSTGVYDKGFDVTVGSM